MSNGKLEKISIDFLFKFLDSYIGRFFKKVGDVALLSYKTLVALFKYKLNLKEFENQLFAIGNKTLSVVLLTAVFTGMVLALQFIVGLSRFGLKMYSGQIVGLSLSRELAPVLTSLMIAARVGSGITAEIGSMVVTEQVMAIEAMGANPIQKLVVPRVLATVIAAPLLEVIAFAIGIIGGMVITIMEAGVSASFYMDQVWKAVNFDDFGHGVAKTLVFGFLIAIVACYEGLNTKGGTEGVGVSTTKTVVISSILIFISDFFLTKLFILF